jgi:hypothetical protein
MGFCISSLAIDEGMHRFIGKELAALIAEDKTNKALSENPFSGREYPV